MSPRQGLLDVWTRQRLPGCGKNQTEDSPGKVGLIGLPTWMWVEDPGAHTLGPITRSASAGGYSVSATAKVSKVVWRMGDGTNVVCHGPGTIYQDRYGATESPTRGHTYTHDGRDHTSVLPSVRRVVPTPGGHERGMEHVPRAGLGGSAWFGFYLLIALICPTGMGFGDVKLAGLLGICLGWLGWGVLLIGGFLGFAFGAAWSFILIAVGRSGGRR